MKIINRIFYFEALALNCLMALYCILLPEHFIAQYTTKTALDISIEMIRWYGGLLAVIGYILFRALQLNERKILKPVLEGFLLGDIIHIAAGLYYIFKIQSAWFPVLAMILISIFLGIRRILWLIQNHKAH